MTLANQPLPMEVEPPQTPLQPALSAMGALGTLAAFRDTRFTVRMMFGTRLAAIVLAMADDGMFADFAGAAFTGAGVIFHRLDSIVVVVEAWPQRHTLRSNRPRRSLLAVVCASAFHSWV